MIFGYNQSKKVKEFSVRYATIIEEDKQDGGCIVRVPSRGMLHAGRHAR